MIWRVILTRSRVLRDPFIISHPFLFVKGFLKSFFKIFYGSFWTVPWPQRKCPTIISQLFSFVKRFLKSFSKTFSWLSWALWKLFPSQSDLRIISHLFSFVKRFLKSFSTFFVIFRLAVPIRRIHTAVFFAPLVCVSRWQLAYYSTLLFNCQGVFSKFFDFGGFGTFP